MNYIVYKTTNLVNGKVYIGVHRTNPDINDGYIGCVVSKRDKKLKSKRGFSLAVKKYGYDNFKRETLFIYPDTEEGMRLAYKKEEELVTIDFVKDSGNYNLTVGGKLTVYNTIKKTISQYTIDGKFIRTWESITEAEEALGLSSITQNLLGKSKYCGNYLWKYYTNEDDIPPVTVKEKTVYLFDLSGNLIKVWPSGSQASLQFENSNAAKVAIGNVCSNRARSAYGYYWSFKNKFEYQKFSKEKLAIAKYSNSGEFLESYNNIYEASSLFSLKGNPTAVIYHCIAGYQKTAFGFRWRYFYGNTSNIKPL